MKNGNFLSHFFIVLLITVFTFLPAQLTLCQAAEVTAVTLPMAGNSEENGNTEKKTAVVNSDETDPAIDAAEEDDESMSTGMKVGLAVGAAAAVGAGIALAAGSGSDSGGSSGSTEPPTAASLVGAWSAAGDQPGSGRTYTGTYHLYDGGGLGYDLNVSSGEHLVGSGSWRITEYLLEMHTDHGSLYSGQFTPGVYNIIHMNANTQWNLTLTR